MVTMFVFGISFSSSDSVVAAHGMAAAPDGLADGLRDRTHIRVSREALLASSHTFQQSSRLRLRGALFIDIVRVVRL
jgi:hypothetical protein